MPESAASPEFEREIAALIVRGLNLPVDAATIQSDTPLYGEGLGLDSIDILELALLVSSQYGVQIRADDQQNQQIFSSLRHFAAYVAAKRSH